MAQIADRPTALTCHGHEADHAIATGLHQITALNLTVQWWGQRTRLRQTLQDLDAHLLRDIGISREIAELEASKPFWA